VRLSTRVIDSSFGVLAADVRVVLRRRAEDGWAQLAVGRTGSDGGLADWHEGPLGTGTYQLEFDIDGYYAALGSVPLHPRVIVEFRVSDPTLDLHLPLLVTPNSFHAFRG
jgi:5-hydroxyisourate hydrolase